MILFIIGIIWGIFIGMFVFTLMCVASKSAEIEESFYESQNTYDLKDNKRGFERISEAQFEKDFEVYRQIIIKYPKRATKLSAGYDCFAPYDISLEPGEDAKIPTGLKAYMEPGEVLIALPRSGLGFKYYCRLANTIGVIDADYINADNEGHIFVKIRNEGNKQMIIKQGDAMCQFIFMPFLLADGDSFENGERRNGGFGSTTKE